MSIFDKISDIFTVAKKSVKVAVNATADFIAGTSTGPQLGQTKYGSGLQNLKKGAEDAVTTLGITKGIQVVEGTLGASNIAISTAKVAVANPKTSLAIGGTAYLASKSEKLSGDILKAPKAIDTFATNAGKLYDNPSLTQAEKTFTDTPILTSAVALGGGLVLGKGVSSIISTTSNTLAIKENTKATAGGVSKINDNLGTSSPTTVGTNKYDVQLAEENNKAQIQALKEQNETAIKIAKLQAESITTPQVVAPASVPAVATAPVKKTTAKKKTTKKKASTKHKYKSRKKVNGKWVYKY